MIYLSLKEFESLPTSKQTGPVKLPSGNIFWYNEGNIHRLDGPAVEYINGNKAWYKNNKLHRIHGPAIEFANGTKFWYFEGKLHRLDGPAMEFTDGEKQYWLDNISYPYNEWYSIIHNLEKFI